MCRRDISASSNVFGNFIIIELLLDSANSGFSTETTKRSSLPKNNWCDFSNQYKNIVYRKTYSISSLNFQ